jgi:hypothetical protein
LISGMYSEWSMVKSYVSQIKLNMIHCVQYGPNFSYPLQGHLDD